mmetsp:Transcript_48679/g.137650  ORF Transcript_48679/g.137650 Transcript_48679/m.137650 type:complete len:207 (+) Transcript_48679:343-963(+)
MSRVVPALSSSTAAAAASLVPFALRLLSSMSLVAFVTAGRTDSCMILPERGRPSGNDLAKRPRLPLISSVNSSETRSLRRGDVGRGTLLSADRPWPAMPPAMPARPGSLIVGSAGLGGLSSVLSAGLDGLSSVLAITGVRARGARGGGARAATTRSPACVQEIAGGTCACGACARPPGTKPKARRTRMPLTSSTCRTAEIMVPSAS